MKNTFNIILLSLILALTTACVTTKSKQLDLQELAEQGDAEAQLALSNAYFLGSGVPEDKAQSAAWKRKAADQGLAKAQYGLGLNYYMGWGVEKDHTQAAVWFRKAADQGHADAQYSLGRIYYIPIGPFDLPSFGNYFSPVNRVPEDAAQAVIWYRKAAEQGHKEAQYNLGLMYYNGNGVPMDFAQAIQWYRKAADQDHAEAQCRLGGMFYSGEGGAKDDALAVSWWLKAANQGVAEAQYDLGLIYFHGIGLPQKDPVQAYMWITLAADQHFEGATGDRNKITKLLNPEQIEEGQRLAREWLAAHPKKSY